MLCPLLLRLPYVLYLFYLFFTPVTASDSEREVSCVIRVFLLPSFPPPDDISCQSVWLAKSSPVVRLGWVGSSSAKVGQMLSSSSSSSSSSILKKGGGGTQEIFPRSPPTPRGPISKKCFRVYDIIIAIVSQRSRALHIN